jgi:hypothetical protein
MKKGIDLFLILVLLVTVGLLVYFGMDSGNTVDQLPPKTTSTFTAVAPVTENSVKTSVLSATPVPTLVIIPTGTATFIPQPTNTATTTPTVTDTVTAVVFTPLSPLDQEIKTGMERGNRIIQAIEAYHSAKGEYPPTLDVLLPTYLSDIPMTSTGQAYFYRLFDGSSPLADEVYWVSFRAINQDHVACTYFGRLDAWNCDYASP